MKRYFLIGALIALLSSCAMQTEVNKQIAASNASRFEAFTSGMVGCGENAACQVGLSMAFSAGLGQQKFEREDSVVDYLKVGVPYANIGARVFEIWYDNRDEEQLETNSSIVLKDLSASEGGTINIGGFNRTRSNVIGEGSADWYGSMKPSEVVIVEPQSETKVE